MMTHLALQWIINADELVAQDPIEAAIQNYTAQKKAFISMLEEAGMEGASDFVKKAQDEMDNELATSVKSETGDVAAEIMDAVEVAVMEMISNLNTNALQHWERKIETAKFKKTTEINSTHDEIALLSNRWKEDMYYELFGGKSETLLNSVAQQLSTKTQSNLNVLSTDIAGMIKGYARRVAITKLSNRYAYADAQGSLHKHKYVETTKGYVAEQWWTQIVNKVLKPYSEKIGALQTQPYSKQGSETKIDIFLGSPNQLADIVKNKCMGIIETVETQALAQQGVLTYEPLADNNFVKGWGIQSKSWAVSQEEWGNTLNYSKMYFGSTSSLIPEGTAAYIWHAGMFNVMSNILQVLGPSNVLFTAKKEIMWTADLLAQIKKQQYVLAFRLSKKHEPPKITSGEVYALPHNDANIKHGKYD